MTSIGANTFPILAAFVIGKMEDEIMRKFSEKCLFYTKYVDDTILLYKEDDHELPVAIAKSFQELEQKTESAVEIHQANSIQFLDVKMEYSNGVMSWMNNPNIYKSSARLNFKSRHQGAVFRGIAKNALKKASTLSSVDKKEQARLDSVKRLLDNEYPLKMVGDLWNKECGGESRREIRNKRKFMGISSFYGVNKAMKTKYKAYQ